MTLVRTLDGRSFEIDEETLVRHQLPPDQAPSLPPLPDNPLTRGAVTTPGRSPTLDGGQAAPPVSPSQPAPPAGPILPPNPWVAVRQGDGGQLIFDLL
jgi:hypothetical protein